MRKYEGQFKYEDRFKPFERKGYPLEAVLEWLKKTTGADDQIVDQVLAETMLLVSQGEKFEVAEEFKDYPDMAISHYMEAKARTMMLKLERTKVQMFQEMEAKRLEERQKILSKYDEELDRRLNGSFGQRVRRFVGLTYEPWENE